MSSIEQRRNDFTTEGRLVRELYPGASSSSIDPSAHFSKVELRCPDNPAWRVGGLHASLEADREIELVGRRDLLRRTGLRADVIASVAAIVFAVVTSVVVGFQLALALGAPWGAYAMGGRFPGEFPPSIRVAAVVQAVLLSLIVLIVLSRAGFLLPQWAGVATWAVWVAVAVSAVALVLNTMTPSRDERRVWAPVAAVMLICSLAVALSTPR